MARFEAYRKPNDVEKLAFIEADEVYPRDLQEHFRSWEGIIADGATVRFNIAGETMKFDEHKVIIRSTEVVDELTRWMKKNHDWPWSAEYSDLTVDNIAQELGFVEGGERWAKAILPLVMAELLRLRWLHKNVMDRGLDINSYAMAAEVAAHIFAMKDPGWLAEVYKTMIPAALANLVIGG